MTLATFDTYRPKSSAFLIPDLLCPWITLLSGKPKMGKSLLAGHLAEAYLTGGEVLGRDAGPGGHRVYWAGFEAGWRQELYDRWHSRGWFDRLVYDEEPEEPRSRSLDDWKGLGYELKTRGVTLTVIDSLYGISGGANLDRAQEVKPMFEVLREWPDKHGIAVLLLAHAGGGFKGGDGSAAHSYAIEAEARHLLKLSKANKNRKVSIAGNATGDKELIIRLDLDGCEVIGGDSRDDSRGYDRAPIADEIWRLLDAGQGVLKNASAAGRFIDPLNHDAGRTKVNRWINGKLLARNGDGGPIIPGPKLPPRTAGG